MIKTLSCLIAALALSATHAMAQAPTSNAARNQLDVLAGDWTLTDASGATGRSHVEIAASGAMLFERREMGSDGALPLWFAFSERAHGWTQLFPSPNGIREFTLLSPVGQWPLVFGGDVTLQDGSGARFRLTMSQPDPDHGERRLEISRDAGVSWQIIFAYAYRRIAAAGAH